MPIDIDRRLSARCSASPMHPFHAAGPLASLVPGFCASPPPRPAAIHARPCPARPRAAASTPGRSDASPARGGRWSGRLSCQSLPSLACPYSGGRAACRLIVECREPPAAPRRPAALLWGSPISRHRSGQPARQPPRSDISRWAAITPGASAAAPLNVAISTGHPRHRHYGPGPLLNPGGSEPPPGHRRGGGGTRRPPAPRHAPPHQLGPHVVSAASRFRGVDGPPRSSKRGTSHLRAKNPGLRPHVAPK